MKPLYPDARVVTETEPQTGTELPSWPLTAAFVGYPLWWVLGLSDVLWPVFAAIMAFYLARQRRVLVPLGFGLWLLFMLWMMCSVIQLDAPLRVLGFGYRYLTYVAVTVFLVYVYNARSSLTVRKVCGILTLFWSVLVVGGYLGLLFPTYQLRTPVYYLLPRSLLANELVNEMAVRRLTQFDPAAFSSTFPRPSAPLLYTNTWGNAYSLLLPFILVYLTQVRGTRRFWVVLAALPLSLVPAFLTVNRGMFLALILGLVYVGLRALLAGRAGVTLTVMALGLVGVVAVYVLPVQQHLTDRLAKGRTEVVRASLYTEAFDRTLKSPIFGYGAPRPSETAGAPSVGTQGQLWMILFSHGFMGAALFVAWLLFMFFRTLRRMDALGLALNTVLVMSLLEIFYYGFLPVGLTLVMVGVGIGVRPSAPVGRGSPAAAPRALPSTVGVPG